MLRTLILVAAGATAFAAPAAQREDRAAAQIERALTGLTPGQTQSCITPSRSGDSQRVGDTLLIKDRGGVLHVSNFDAGCAPRMDEAMVSRRSGNQICRGDIVQFQDLTSGTFQGACAYGSFTPYRRMR